MQIRVAGRTACAYYSDMSLEEHILDSIKRLPVEKRKAVLAFVESMQETGAGAQEELVLSAEEQLENWNDWAAHGAQGPIEDDTPPEFP